MNYFGPFSGDRFNMENVIVPFSEYLRSINSHSLIFMSCQFGHSDEKLLFYSFTRQKTTRIS